ncbi:MAG: ribose transport system substrate-binding protein [Pseudonocardiales bacterium]|nr:ribose transport system substrate-binding protein [Pseudonocardiales bacterium]
MNSRLRLAVAAVSVAFMVTACGSSSSPQEAAPAAESGGDAAQAATEALAKLAGQVLSKGPHGETAAAASTADLTEDEVAKVKAMHATAAIVLHYGGNDWSTAQVAGLKDRFGQLGIKVVAVTDANFKPDKQVSDIETVLAKKPDIIVSIPTDPVATADAYRKASASGVKLVFMDNAPQGLEAGTGYVSVVSADNFGNGVASAHLMAKALDGKGKVGVIFHEADFFVTKQRYQGFKDTLTKDYPDIDIVEEQGIGGPDFAGDAQGVANAMLTKHPDLDGIWAVWDVPAEGVMAAARAAGRSDLKIATEDLGKNVAIELAKNGLVVGLGAQVPFDQGVTEANLGAGALLGKKAEPYIALSSLAVDHANVLEAWKQVYHQDPPSDLRSAYKK